MSKSLLEFLRASEKDQRISATHLAIFSALLQYSASRGAVNPISAFSYQIVPIAKISLTTYHKTIRELSSYGYLKYEPSLKNNIPSRIYFLNN
ncbi:hypothetical protein Q7C23_19355 [Flavobacterium sp. LAR06]